MKSSWHKKRFTSAFSLGSQWTPGRCSRVFGGSRPRAIREGCHTIARTSSATMTMSTVDLPARGSLKSAKRRWTSTASWSHQAWRQQANSYPRSIEERHLKDLLRWHLALRISRSSAWRTTALVQWILSTKVTSSVKKVLKRTLAPYR